MNIPNTMKSESVPILKYTYQPLDPGYIRLCELQPGRDKDVLACRLIPVEISGAIDFEAISYVWGDAVFMDAVVVQGETHIRITSALSDVLKRVRVTNQRRVLWVDGICINQADLHERSVQVSLMKSIYINAKQVLGWLGPSSGDAELATQSILQLHAYSKKEVPPGQLLKYAGLYGEELVIWKKAVKEMLCSPLFERVWVLQELGLAAKAVLLYGDSEIDVQVVNETLQSILQRAASHFSEFESHADTVCTTVSLYKQNYDFLELLQSARGHDASDKRDHIYGLLGHPKLSREERALVQPDYTKSIAEIYTNLTTELIRHNQDLRILSAVFHGDQNIDIRQIPSWVPRWSDGVQLTTFGLKRNCYYDAGKGIIFSGAFLENPPSLVVSGIAIDYVGNCSEPLRPFSYSTGPTGVVYPNDWPDIHKLLRLSAEEEFRLLTTLRGGIRDGSPEEDCQQPKHEVPSIIALLKGEEYTPKTYYCRRKRVVVLEGGEHSLFVNEARLLCPRRRFFSTLDGYFGLGPRGLAAYDICCILFGANVPLILRKIGAHYILVGEAYVEAFMWGKAIDLWKSGKLRKQEFKIL